MADYSNVFQSEIVRSQRKSEELNELLDVTPAVPAHINKEQVIDFHFVPVTGKRFVPNKRSKLRVKSVRDLRLSFEKDVLAYLPGEIEKQEEYLFKKIKDGSAKDMLTKNNAKKMLMSDRPLSKSVLQMLMNINPEDETYNTQYVLYEGKKIRINGSTGGKELIRIDCDLSGKKVFKKSKNKSNSLKKKKGLLKNSLAVKFKPGPLVKKNTLDVSYQKYNVGATELVNLPQPVLCVKQVSGVALEPSVSKFVQNLCDNDGTISQKWAEFSVLAVQNSDSRMDHNERENCVTFDLNYTCNQKRILMRRDIDSNCNISLKQYSPETSHPPEDLLCEIKTVISKLLDAVEIHELQDELFTKDDNDEEDFHESPLKLAETEMFTKEKKKRRFMELGKLDVTVIQLPDERQLEEKIEACTNSFCALGCICTSLQNPYNIKQHCGRIKCMFRCQCNFSKYDVDPFGKSELLPAIINLDKEINFQLAKEEKKFHQTVVVTGNKSVVLKTQKRTSKVSKRYADFYSDMISKTDVKLQQEVSVELVKLNCENIETWCMVHRLYRCFCKGKFTHSTITELDEANITTEHNPKDEIQQLNPSEPNNNMNTTKYSLRTEKLNNFKDYKFSESDIIEFQQLTDDCNQERCARAMTYKRKYHDSFYSEMQNKIIMMEKNDFSLRKRMQQLHKQATGYESQASEELKQSKRGNKSTTDTHTVPDLCLNHEEVNVVNDQNDDQNECPTAEERMANSSKSEDNESQSTSNSDLQSKQSVQIQRKHLTRLFGSEEEKKSTEDKDKLVAWLENSFRQYKRRSILGKIVLEPPKNRKLVIYPWDFIVNRYKEKKNIVLVTKNMPFRVFMAVDTKNSFFDNCVNISEIQLAELHKYPIAVQKMLTSGTKIDNNFCILLGLPCCWEFVGCLSKNEQSKRTPNCSSGDEQHPSDSEVSADSDIFHLDILDDENDNRIAQKTSKWFVLIVEADLGEMQFSEQGFFVRYQSIIKAVNVARLSGKTVRLSSQKSVNKTDTPQFGVYAIPAVHDFCVFIGPYQDGDALGIEIIKSSTGHCKNTKGFWISTTRNENFEIIENPLTFLPTDRDSIEYVSLDDISERLPEISASAMRQVFNKCGVSENSCNSTVPKATAKANTLINHPLRLASTASVDTSKDDDNNHPLRLASTASVDTSKDDDNNHPLRLASTASVDTSKDDDNNHPLRLASTASVDTSKDDDKYVPLVYTRIQSKPPEKIPKFPQKKSTTVKPIRISKDNALYKVIPKVGFPRLTSLLIAPNRLNPISSVVKPVDSSSTSIAPKNLAPIINEINPIAEITPQIKIVDVYSESTTQPQQSSKKNENTTRRGMFILKPEEINKRILKTTVNNTDDQQIDEDIENFLGATVIECNPTTSIAMDSDDEHRPQRNNVRDIFIECSSVSYLGFIKGKMDDNNHISFKFPGFNYTNFYPQPEAYVKINQVLSRKVYVPKSINLEWKIVTKPDELRSKKMLTSQQLGVDFVLTLRGMKHKGDIITYAARANNLKQKGETSPVTVAEEKPTTVLSERVREVEKASEALIDQECRSEEMEERNDQLLQELTTLTKPEVYRKNPIANEMTPTQREQIAERLQHLLFTTDDD